MRTVSTFLALFSVIGAVSAIPAPTPAPSQERRYITTEVIDIPTCYYEATAPTVTIPGPGVTQTVDSPLTTTVTYTTFSIIGERKRQKRDNPYVSTIIESGNCGVDVTWYSTPSVTVPEPTITATTTEYASTSTLTYVIAINF